MHREGLKQEEHRRYYMHRSQMPRTLGHWCVELRGLEDQDWNAGLPGARAEGVCVIPSPAGGGCSDTGAGPRWHPGLDTLCLGTGHLMSLICPLPQPLGCLWA